MKKLFFLSLVLCVHICHAQKTGFYPSNYIRFLGENNDTLYSAFTGGLANPMMSNIDLNNDGRQDLFVFDRADGKVMTYLNIRTKDSARLIYTPQYEAAFPNIVYFAFLKDFNGDGKADIFMHGVGYSTLFNSHLVVFKNVSTKDSLKFIPYKTPVLRENKFNIDKLTTSNTEIPTFADMDNDGDVDMLQFDYAQTSLIYYYKNMSRELYGHSDSLTFWLYDQCWGMMTEGDTTTDFKIGLTNCNQNQVKRQKSAGHSGSAMLALDTDGDGDKDMLVGDVGKPHLFYFENAKIKFGNTPRITDSIDYYSKEYPITKPVNINGMPLACSVDINGDGINDLVASAMDHDTKRRNMVWMYHNTSKVAKPLFKFNKTNFLEDETVDWGMHSAPCALYYNNDSLPDLLIAVEGESGGLNADHLVLYLNVGTKTKAVFKLENDDFLGLSSEGLSTITPAVGDLDNDGKQDLMIGLGTGKILYYRNTGTNGKMILSWPGIPLQEKVNGVNENLDAGDNSMPASADMNNDAKADLLVGNRSNTIKYYKNISTPGSPLFELAKDSFLGIAGEQQLAPCLADLDKDGKTDLLVGTSNGKVHLYNSVTESSDLSTPEKDIFYNFNTKAFAPHPKNKNLIITAASLDQDAKPDLLIGNMRGGLYFMGSQNNGQKLPVSIKNQAQPDAFSQLLIYPNPAKEYIIIESKNALQQKASVKILDISGKQLYENNIMLSLNSPAKIELPALAEGLYFVRVQSNDSKPFTTVKLFITK